MKETEKDASNPVRRAVVQTLSSVEDLVYVGLGLLLTIVTITLLIIALKSVLLALWTRALGGQAVSLLDQILLILLVIELLYTVQVSFRERGLIAEPFLVVALIEVIRRVLVLTRTSTQAAGSGRGGLPACHAGFGGTHRYGARRFFDHAAAASEFRVTVAKIAFTLTTALDEHSEHATVFHTMRVICIAQTSFAPRSILKPITEKSGLCVDEL